MRKKKPSIITIYVFVILVISSFYGIVSSNTDITVDPVEYVEILAPNTNLARNQWSAMIAENLGKIGFNVNFTNENWNYVLPRTLSWEPQPSAPNIIPNATAGGYDLFAIALTGNIYDPISYDPTYSYANTKFSASGINFAHYNNQIVTDLCEKYTAELDPVVRATYAKDIQKIIAQEIPYIPLMNENSLWAYDALLKSNYTADDWLLISTNDIGDGWKAHKATSNALVYAHTYELQEFTSFKSYSNIAAQYLAPVQIGLFERDPNDPNYANKPLIAASEPVWDSTKTVANVSLRHDVTFSNGHKLNATDVVNTYRMSLTPKVKSKNFQRLNDSLKHTDGNGNLINVNNSVYADGEWNVIFEFEGPHFDAIDIMSFALYDHQVIGTPENPAEPNYDFNSDGVKYSIGAGPFILEKYNTTSDNVILRARTDYWNGPIELSTMEFNKYIDKAAALADLEGGKVDIIDNYAYLTKTEVENVAGVEYTFASIFNVQMLAVNMDHPVFGTGVDTPLGKSDPSRAAEAANYVRLAISHAIPRDTIIRNITNGMASNATSLWTEYAEGYDSSLSPHVYDLDLARQYMSKAGYIITTHTSTTPTTSTLPNSTSTLTTPTTSTLPNSTSTSTTPTTSTLPNSTSTSTTPTSTTPTSTTTDTINNTSQISTTPSFNLSFNSIMNMLLISFIAIIIIRRRNYL